MMILTLETPTVVVSAADIHRRYRHDKSLPGEEELGQLLADLSSIPKEWQKFTLVFPRVEHPGLSEGGCNVTDPFISCLIWRGENWEESLALAGPDGWGRTGPDNIVNPMIVRTA